MLVNFELDTECPCRSGVLCANIIVLVKYAKHRTRVSENYLEVNDPRMWKFDEDGIC